MQSGNQILLNKNDWTNNKFYIEQLKDCFELATKAKLQEKYWLLIVDKQAFYISNKFIKFVKANKIIYLFLSLHLIYLL